MSLGKDGGSLIVSRAINVELALFLAQLTGSCLYADTLVFWKQIHQHASSPSEFQVPAGWAPVSETLRSVEFALEINPQFNLEMRKFSKLPHLRSALRQVWKAVRERGGGPITAAIAEQLVGALRAADERMRAAWAARTRPAGPSATLRCELEISIPPGGFGRNAVRR